MNVKPLFEFGHGLSYTSFLYANLSITGNNFVVKATVDIKNIGDRDGTEIV